LEGNFLPEGNFGLWKEIGRKYCYKEGNEKEILFYLIISKNKAIFIQFCAKEDSENAISNDLETPYFQNFPLGANHGGARGPPKARSHRCFFSKVGNYMYLGQDPRLAILK
jgi:hypothetical protein